MIVRPAKKEDLAKIPRLVEAAFGGHSEVLLVEALRESKRIELELVATVNYQFVGHLILSRLISPKNCLALSPLSVHPDWQRKGFGSALIRAAAERAEEDGWAAIFVLGDPHYYDRFGFDNSQAGNFDTPYSVDFTSVLVLDQADFGGLEREIEYPDAFLGTA